METEPWPDNEACVECGRMADGTTTGGNLICDHCARKSGLSWCEVCQHYTDEWSMGHPTCCDDCTRLSYGDYDEMP